jgi:hypothetical protein
MFEDPNGAPVNYDQTPWENIFPAPPVDVKQESQPVLPPPVTPVINQIGTIVGGSQ